MKNRLTEIEIQQIIEWDVKNWQKALLFWHDRLKTGEVALELGANHGGPSLWLANQGFEVVCSDISNPEVKAKPYHQSLHASNIRYEAISALDIPYVNKFDVIVLKSILGGIARDGNDAAVGLVLDQIQHALKPGGQLLFAENLKSSKLHQFFRKRFVKWGQGWNYLPPGFLKSELEKRFDVEFKSTGFLGTFGRTERQRGWLAEVDKWIVPVLPKSMHYIAYGVATKK